MQPLRGREVVHTLEHRAQRPCHRPRQAAYVLRRYTVAVLHAPRRSVRAARVRARPPAATSNASGAAAPEQTTAPRCSSRLPCAYMQAPRRHLMIQRAMPCAPAARTTRTGPSNAHASWTLSRYRPGIPTHDCGRRHQQHQLNQMLPRSKCTRRSTGRGQSPQPTSRSPPTVAYAGARAVALRRRSLSSRLLGSSSQRRARRAELVTPHAK